MCASKQEPGSSGAGVQPAEVERELTEMWRLMNEGEAAGTEGVMRVCVLNLITRRTPEEDRRAVDEMLDEVTEVAPCRAFVLLLDRESSTNGMRAFVSSRCQLSTHGPKQVCCEQITIEATGSSVLTVSSAVAPLLVPDVPVFLWWNGMPDPADLVFSRLAQLADRLVIDSACFGNPVRAFLQLDELLRDAKQSRAMSDLNWGRLTSWRSLVASLWDVADYRPYLSEIGSLELEYDAPAESGERISSKALLGLGWLASRLRWRLLPGEAVQHTSRTRLTYHGPSGREIQVKLVPSGEPEGREGPLKRLVLACSAPGRPSAEFRVGLRRKGCRLETISRVGAAELSMDRVLQYEPRSEGARLAAELAFRDRDRVYEQTVHAAAEAARALAAGVE